MQQTREIGDALGLIINQIIAIMFECLSMLDSIHFMGITLLDYIITLSILSVVIPLLIARLKSNPKAEKGGRDRVEDSN